jgi:ABC-type antimicrobial peptide transport system permease subunit
MDTVQKYMAFTEEVLGFFPISVEAFILQDFKLAHLSVTFLQLIFNLVMLLLFSISVLLIYSLLMLSVESKSFEFGVMRMVGLSKNSIIFLVVLQSFLFVVPAIITGFIVSLAFLQGAKIFADQQM